MSLGTLKVSIVCPTHNCEDYIGDTIRSILRQTHQNFEILVVDDCSYDSTVQKVLNFHDPRIILFQNSENHGAAFSRNRAIAHASGDYVAFLDGDDMWAPDKLEKQLRFMAENHYAFSYTKYRLIDEQGQDLKVIYSGPEKISRKQFLRCCYPGCLTVMYRRDLYPDLSIPDTIKKRNDYALWLKLSEKADCYLLDQELGYYRKSNGSLSSESKIRLLKYHKVMFANLYGMNSCKAWFFALRNALYYINKQAKYKSEVRG